ncbi:MAG: KH domain-containing protein [Verrucomicrobia bacterium]|nr:KH domain-containing protein [Verrucomicrobiota bacterium]
MKPFIEYVVRALVDFPEQVDVREAIGERGIIYELRLNKADIGKVIGKHGRTIQALRTLVAGGSMKLGKRATVEIIEEPPAAPPPPQPSPAPAEPPLQPPPASPPVP